MLQIKHNKQNLKHVSNQRNKQNLKHKHFKFEFNKKYENNQILLQKKKMNKSRKKYRSLKVYNTWLKFNIINKNKNLNT